MKPTPEEHILALLPKLDRPALRRVMQAIVDELAKNQPPVRPQTPSKEGEADPFQPRFEGFKAGRG